MQLSSCSALSESTCFPFNRAAAEIFPEKLTLPFDLALLDAQGEHVGRLGEHWIVQYTTEKRSAPGRHHDEKC